MIRKAVRSTNTLVMIHQKKNIPSLIGRMISTHSVNREQSLGQTDKFKPPDDEQYLRSYAVNGFSKDSRSDMIISHPKNPDVSFKIEFSQTNKDKMLSPLQYSLGSLAGCEVATLRFLAKQMGLHVGSVEHKKVEGWLDVRGYGKGDPTIPSHFQRVEIEALVETDATDEQLKLLKERVEHQCPIHSMFKASGCHVNSTWISKTPASNK